MAGETWPLPDVEFTLDARRTALLLIDLQYYDADPRSGIGKNLEAKAPGYTRYYFDRLERTVIPAIQSLLAFFRQNGLPVVFVTYASETDDGRDLNPLLRARNEQRKRTIGVPSVYPRSAPEARVLDALAPLPGELVVNKVSQSSFNSSALDALLRNMGVEGLAVVGVVTNVCVEATARDAADRGYRTVIVDDGCAAWDAALHDATLRSFRRFLGRVSTAGELVRELAGQLAT